MAAHAVCARFRFRVSHRAKRAGVVSRPAAVVVVVAVSDPPPSRRPAAALFCVAVSVVLLHPSASHAETLKQMTVAGGNASFLEREFVDLKYAGVKTVTPGTAAIDGFSEATECVSVTYDADKIHFASLMRTYWQHADPTNVNGSFAEKGDRFKGAVWVWDEGEKQEVETSVSNLKASGIFGVDSAGPKAFVNLKVLDAPPKNFTEFPDEQKNALKTNPKPLEKQQKARDESFKNLWGFVQFCQDKVCGYVRFAPKCQNECLDVFPQYRARNAGVPELEGNIKITGRS
jgi:peptide methionine sulfoxide reductase MsrA